MKSRSKIFIPPSDELAEIETAKLHIPDFVTPIITMYSTLHTYIVDG
jgi:hypothetical protein